MHKDIEKIIYNEPMILTRPGWTYHPPVTDENGKLRLGFPEHEAFIEINKKFYDAPSVLTPSGISTDFREVQR